jgi:hypothetical protein
MPEEYTFLLIKCYSRESRTNFPGKWEWKNSRDPGKLGTGNPGNETLVVRQFEPNRVMSEIQIFYRFCCDKASLSYISP